MAIDNLRAKSPSESAITMTELVIPNDSNILGNVLGGTVMHWIDLSAAMAAHRHCGSICVTAAIEGMAFLHPIKLGQLALIKARVVFVGKTSLIVKVVIHSEDMDTGETRKTTEAHLTFVCLGKDGKPRAVPPLRLESDQDKNSFEAAKEIRQRRLELRKQERE
jgi:acyl-CoA hydrolase